MQSIGLHIVHLLFYLLYLPLDITSGYSPLQVFKLEAIKISNGKPLEMFSST
jgi:hypothetical protein